MKYRVIGLSLLCMLLFIGNPSGVSPTWASTSFTVDSILDEIDSTPGDGACLSIPSGVCTLRAALMEANALTEADTINLPAGVYLLTISGTDENAAATGDLDINSSVILAGADASDTIINGNQIDRVLQISGAVSVTLSAVTITGGRPPTNISGVNNGGGISNGGYLSINDSIVSYNETNSAGGGIDNNQAVTLTNSSVLSNTSAYGASGILNNATLAVNSSLIAYNHTTNDQGGGLWNNSQATVVGSVISDNLAQGSGSAGKNLGVLWFIDSQVSGDVYCLPGSTTYLIRSAVSCSGIGCIFLNLSVFLPLSMR